MEEVAEGGEAFPTQLVLGKSRVEIQSLKLEIIVFSTFVCWKPFSF